MIVGDEWHLGAAISIVYVMVMCSTEKGVLSV